MILQSGINIVAAIDRLHEHAGGDIAAAIERHRVKPIRLDKVHGDLIAVGVGLEHHPAQGGSVFRLHPQRLDYRIVLLLKESGAGAFAGDLGFHLKG